MNKLIGKQNEEIKINYKGQEAKALVRMFGYSDHEFKVCYIPSLALSAYGDTVKEAKEMMKDIVHDFFEGLLALPEQQMIQELKKLGWEKNAILKKKFRNTAPFVDKDGILNNLNLPKETAIKEEFISI